MSHNVSFSSETSFERYSQIALSFASVKIGLLLVRHPIHVIQTNKQASPNLSNSQIITDIYKKNGVKGFYKSTPASIMKICLVESYRGVLMIQIPNIVRSYLSKYRSDFHPIVTTLTTSAIAVPLISAIDASLTCPLTRMSTLQMTTGEKTSLKNIYNNHIKGNVVASLYRGFTPLYIQTALLWGNFFVIDDLMKYLLQKRFNQVSYSGLAVASVIGGGIQTCINVIPDTVRVHMQKTATDNLGMHATAKKLIRLHGMRSLFSAVPHKLIGGVAGYSYKSLLRHFWSSQNDKK